jgi:hypothetical protein
MSDVENTMMLEPSRDEPDDYVRISAHPRAQRAVARSKAMGGLIGFLIGLWLADRAGLPAWDAGVRALVGGIAGYVLMWLASVQIWRQIVIGEYRAAEKRRAESRELRRRELEQRAQARAEAAAAAREGA